jgi:hypothetical protein
VHWPYTKLFTIVDPSRLIQPRSHCSLDVWDQFNSCVDVRPKGAERGVRNSQSAFRGEQTSGHFLERDRVIASFYEIRLAVCPKRHMRICAEDFTAFSDHSIINCCQWSQCVDRTKCTKYRSNNSARCIPSPSILCRVCAPTGSARLFASQRGPWLVVRLNLCPWQDGTSRPEWQVPKVI